MSSNDVYDTFGYDALLDYGSQAITGLYDEGLDSLTEAERNFSQLYTIFGLGSGDWINWLTGNPPSWLLGSVHITEGINAASMAKLLKATLLFHAPLEDYGKKWESQDIWEKHISSRLEVFEYPENFVTERELLPPGLRGEILFGEYDLTADNPPMDGSLLKSGFTPKTWLEFKESSEAGEQPEIYEQWYLQQPNAQRAVHCLRLHSFEKGRWVALPNPWNGLHSAGSAYTKYFEDFVAEAAKWAEKHWSEVRIFAPNEHPITPSTWPRNVP